MDPTFRRNAGVTLITCAVLACVSINEPLGSHRDPNVPFVRRAIRMMHDRNRNATEQEIAGYYEGLLAGRPTNLLGRARNTEDYRFRGDFLYYEARSHVDVADYPDDPSLRHVTNSHGMPDLEYPIERRPGTRRLALLGDSVTRGQGAPFGESYEALLERHLNELYGAGAPTYELLNFSSTGYRLTQMVDVALEKVPRFSPDVYVVCLTRLSVSRKWGDHVAQLVYDGVDLKYPFLRRLATDANLDSRDPPATMDAKLASYRLSATRWAITAIQEKAKSQGAEVLVLLVPTVSGSDELQRAFSGVPEILAELDVPTIDLLDTFDDVDELLPFMVVDGNIHPNRDGHRRIFEQIQKRLTDSEAFRIIVGSRPRNPVRSTS